MDIFLNLILISLPLLVVVGMLMMWNNEEI